MITCPRCGYNNVDGSVKCAYCGNTDLYTQQSYPQAMKPAVMTAPEATSQAVQPQKKHSENRDLSISDTTYAVQEKNPMGFLGGLIAFFFPFFGILMYILWKETSPKSANKALNLAVIPTIVITIFSLILISNAFSSFISSLNY